MIEPPNIEKLRALCNQSEFQFEHPGNGTIILPIPSYNLIIERANALPAILDELEALRAVVKELAASETWQRFDQDSLCIFCGVSYDHRPDCLISRAKGLVKA